MNNYWIAVKAIVVKWKFYFTNDWTLAKIISAVDISLLRKYTLRRELICLYYSSLRNMLSQKSAFERMRYITEDTAVVSQATLCQLEFCSTPQNDSRYRQR